MSSTPSVEHNPHPVSSLICGSVSLADKEGYAVKLHTDGTVIINSSQGELCWPLITAGGIGAHVAVAFGGEVYVPVDEAVNANTLLTSNGSGLWEASLTNDYATLIALEASTASGDYIRARIIGPEITP